MSGLSTPKNETWWLQRLRRASLAPQPPGNNADFLPRAAELYRRLVAAGLSGDAREANKACIVLGLKGGRTAHMEVRICHSSGKNLSSSAFAR